MAAGGRRQRWIYCTRNRSQQGGERTPPARGLLPLSLLQVLLPGAPFASFLSSASPAAEEGKGGREKSDGGMRACRMGELKKLITRGAWGGRVVRREENGGRQRTDALPPRWKKSDLVSFFFLSGSRDPNGLS